MRTMLALTLLAAVAIATPTIAQGPPPGGPGGPPPGGAPQAAPPPEALLKEVLGLSDDQLTAVRTALEARRQAVEGLMPQLADAEKALGEALTAAAPDAAQVGALALRVQAIRTKIELVSEAFHAAVVKLLTATQLQKASDILALQRSLQAGQALQQLGIL